MSFQPTSSRLADLRALRFEARQLARDRRDQADREGRRGQQEEDEEERKEAELADPAPPSGCAFPEQHETGSYSPEVRALRAKRPGQVRFAHVSQFGAV
ncbi:MAG: hypothetical protein E6J13_16970 [Chloroflexi bacterium]|nr:MAG: hypothetical protein E6J13_16970 [Chloroflexota bacterium]